MRIFITGTDTDVGKTVISSWLCLHLKYPYFKPVQTGNVYDVDTSTVEQLTDCTTYKEVYSYTQPLSPHLAAKIDGDRIDIGCITLPETENLVVEGAGGVLVPLNETELMVDLIKALAIPVILVVRSKLGTINHTLLSLEALRKRSIPVLGVIMNGCNKDNVEAIERYGGTEVLACFPEIGEGVTKEDLLRIPLTKKLRGVFGLTLEHDL